MGRTDSSNVARLFAVVLGLGYVAGGVIGFAVTGFGSNVVADTDDALLGFDLNTFHNVVHVTIGGGLLVASRIRDVAITQGILVGVGLFYLLAAVLGFIDYLQIISIDGSLAADNFLHLFSGGLALVLGLVGISQTSDSDDSWATGQTTAVAAEGPLPIEQRRALWDPDDTYREETY